MFSLNFADSSCHTHNERDCYTRDACYYISLEWNFRYVDDNYMYLKSSFELHDFTAEPSCRRRNTFFKDLTNILVYTYLIIEYRNEYFELHVHFSDEQV